MRMKAMWVLVAGCVSGWAQAQQPVPLVQAPSEPVVVSVPSDGSLLAGLDGRRQALDRISSQVSIKRQPTSPQQCKTDVAQALNAGAYQVFVERQGQVPALVPLEFSVTLRDRVDEKRLAPVCQQSTGLVIAQFPDSIKQSKDARMQHDYVVALMMADWAQTKADGTGLVGREIPPDVVPDPLGVLQKPAVAQ